MHSKTDDLNLSVSGSGEFYISDMTVSNLDCGISGSGDIIINGNGSAAKADISNKRFRKLYGQIIKNRFS